GHTAEEVVAALGLTMADLFPQRRKVVGRQHYEIGDADGILIATHKRVDFDDGTKCMTWHRDGKQGLQGLRVTDLPLYGAEHIAEAPADAEVVVTEGEKARDALRARAILAVGSVTGAGGTPFAKTLQLLRGHPVVLWPDNDPDGRKQMQTVAI